MSREITYDTAADAEVIKGHPEEVSEAVIKSSEPAIDAQLGCHSGSTMKTAAENNQNSEILEKYAEDYPMGPHDKPQSMCPAFGSLRVGLRMRRVATVLSGSACCVYGLTFVSHFYGARRSVGYVPFNSETLVTGKLFEDIRDAVHELADPDHYDAVVVTNLCVPTASGVPLRLLPNEINGVRIIGIDVPGFGVPTHAEAKDILAGAMLNFVDFRDVHRYYAFDLSRQTVFESDPRKSQSIRFRGQLGANSRLLVFLAQEKQTAFDFTNPENTITVKSDVYV